MKESHIPAHSHIGKDLFNPEQVTAVFMQTMQAMSQKVERNEEAPDHDFSNPLAFLSAAMNDPQKEKNENPFFSLLQQSYLLNRQFSREALHHIPKLDSLINRKLASYVRHLADILSLDSGSLQEGWTLSNVRHDLLKWPDKSLEPGKSFGATPGKVVFENDLCQLIQYEALSPKVARRPLVIVPPWMNKPYIFDLGTENSFVQWALESELTVFIISWKKPDQQQSQKTMASYILNGLKAALDQVCQLTGETEVNAVGYCAGGTLLGSLMAHLEAKKDPRIASATLLAAPFDFSKIDPLGIFQFEHHAYDLEDYVERTKSLEGHYIVQVFNLLRINDLIWSSNAKHYLLGKASFPFEMLHWLCDALPIPPQMHSVYLRKICIENSLMERSRLSLEGIPLDFPNMTVPLFIVGSLEDHVAPWPSVYAITQITKAAACKFALSASGHLTGIFVPPGSPNHSYWTADNLPEKPQDWLESAKKQTGSWWHEWRQWLEPYEGGKVPVRPLPKSRILESASG